MIVPKDPLLSVFPKGERGFATGPMFLFMSSFIIPQAIQIFKNIKI